MRNASILAARYLLGFLIVLLLSVNLGACGAATVSHSATPVILSSGPPEASEMAAACDTHRARLRHTPVRMADGTPVWCF